VNDFKAQLTHPFYGSFAYYPDKKQEVAHGAERYSVSSFENGAIFVPLSFLTLLFRQARRGLDFAFHVFGKRPLARRTAFATAPNSISSANFAAVSLISRPVGIFGRSAYANTFIGCRRFRVKSHVTPALFHKIPTHCVTANSTRDARIARCYALDKHRYHRDLRERDCVMV